MEIKTLRIKNFRSLKEISMENLQGLVILIGENASGKTNILEALELFLSSFTSSASEHRGELKDDDWYLWFRGQTEGKPIEFQIILSLDPDEIEELAKVANGKQTGNLRVNRSIVCGSPRHSLYYQNDLIEWSSITLQRKDKVYSAEGVEFNLDSLAQAANRILQKGVTYISLGRENRPTKAHDSILDSVVREGIVKRSEDTTPRGIMTWNRWMSDRKRRIWGQQLEQLECKGKRPFLLKRGIYLPLELEGGGYQAVLNLLEKVESGGDIVAIEEPENHLHPALQKRLVTDLKQLVSEEKKQIFLATHSPFIIDLVNLKSIWFIYTEGLESKVVNITAEEELSNTFWKIGVKPSDFLFANAVLVVEGPIDKEVYTDWAIKIGKPFEDVGILAIDAEGCKNITKYLNSNVIQRTALKLYCLADKNAEWVKEKVEDVVPEENVLFLLKGDLEDYYPREIALRFAEEMALKKGRKETEIPSEIKVGETVSRLDRLLGKDWWKKPLAHKVIEQMRPKQIDDEIKDKLDKIWGDLER